MKANKQKPKPQSLADKLILPCTICYFETLFHITQTGLKVAVDDLELLFFLYSTSQVLGLEAQVIKLNPVCLLRQGFIV